MSSAAMVAKNIRRYRERHGWTQAELARRLAVSQAHVANLELGSKVPSLAMLDRLARALRVKPGRLLE